MADEIEPFDFGRQAIHKRGRPATIKVADSERQACEKCRNPTIKNERCVCTKGHTLDADNCRDYSDASKPKNYYPNFFHNDMRR